MDVIITTINPPNDATQKVNDKLEVLGGVLWIVGDVSGPESYDLSVVEFLTIETQRSSVFTLAEILPERHYCRKNLGYLSAISKSKPEYILETDDDNIPYDSFFQERSLEVEAEVVSGTKWDNIYSRFSDEKVWPRGFPLEELNSNGSAETSYSSVKAYIQQALADQNPDVDAVYRLTGKLPVDFKKRSPVALGNGVWCPFNSQATTTFREAFPLLYLPSYCSFRMTDIWRSFVAQRCLWEMGGNLLFTEALVRQERNEHDLMKDFEDEIPGYLQNSNIVDLLDVVDLEEGVAIEAVSNNLIKCYSTLCSNGIVGEQEMPLVKSWVDDMQKAIA
jgi:hypothetical protein